MFCNFSLLIILTEFMRNWDRTQHYTCICFLVRCVFMVLSCGTLLELKLEIFFTTTMFFVLHKKKGYSDNRNLIYYKKNRNSYVFKIPQFSMFYVITLCFATENLVIT